MRTAAQKTKRRVAKPYTFPAPTRGWVANENLANPTEGGAAVLENWFPTATGLRIRAGSELYATLGQGDMPVRSLFSYVNGDTARLFGATDEAIYNITSITSPFNFSIGDEDGIAFETDTGDTFGQNSTEGLDVLTGTTGGNWVVVQFATAGGVFLVGVNGEDDAFLYDGTDFFPISGQEIFRINYDAETDAFVAGQVLTGGTSAATATILRVFDNGSTGYLWIQGITGTFQDNEIITGATDGSATANGTVGAAIAPAITGVATSDLNYVWIYKSRAWFVEKDSLDAWYLPIDSVGGAATKFPLGGVFGLGGSLLFGATWSLDSGSGLSEQIIFVSTEGEVVVYQGINPGGGSDFAKVGVYRIGKPLGPKAFIRAGGDLVIATDIGFVPLSQAIQRDIAALSPSAVSYPIEVAWNERVDERGGEPWHCEIWPTKQMSVVALPSVGEAGPEMLVTNARTGAWALYTGWDGGCLEVFQERLFFGSSDGRVVEAEVTGTDEGAPFVATVVPLFSDMDSPAALKTIGMARATMLTPYPISERISIQVNFAINLPAAPDAALIGTPSVWGVGLWGVSQWGQEAVKKPQQRWVSVAGSGYSIAPALQITSGAVVPLNTELVRFDLTGMTADIVS